MGPLTTRIAACLTLVACTIPTPRPEPPSTSSRPPQRSEPWTNLLPRGWHVSTYRTNPNPNLIAGLFSAFVANVEHDLTEAWPPFGQSGASRILGDAAVVVEITLVFRPPDEPIRWPSSAEPSIVRRGPSPWRSHRVDLGWRTRWREICRGKEMCVNVIEWHGPAATAGDIELGARVASSVVLRRRWTDPGW